MNAPKKAPQREGAEQASKPAKLPQIVQLVHDRAYYTLPQTPLRFIASPHCHLSGGQIGLWFFLVTNSWTYGQLYVGRWKKNDSRYATKPRYWRGLSQVEIARAMAIVEVNGRMEPVGVARLDEYPDLEVDVTRLNHDLGALEAVSMVYTDDDGRLYPWPFPIPDADFGENLGESANFPESSPFFSASVSLKTAYETRKRRAWEAHIAPLQARYREGQRQIKTLAKKNPDGGGEGLHQLGDFANFFDLTPLDERPQLGESANETVGETSNALNKEVITGRYDSSSSSSAVISALSEYGFNDDDAIAQLIQNCWLNAPDLTEAELLHFLAQKGQMAAKRENPVGFLMVALPKCFKGASFKRFREEQRRIAEREAKAEARRHEPEPEPEPYVPKCSLCKDTGGTVFKPCNCERGTALKEWRKENGRRF